MPDRDPTTVKDSFQKTAEQTLPHASPQGCCHKCFRLCPEEDQFLDTVLYINSG
jgi:hypothetical protein